MGNSINKVDEGLFICGVHALLPMSRLHGLGIKCVLNAAQAELYMHCAVGPRAGAGAEERLEEIPKHFEVLTIGAQDAEDCNLSAHFEDIANFIEAGRQKGGVVVHCAAGVSRASTSTLAYLMIKEKWELNAAFMRVHSVRSCVRPNAGFWRQLRDLECSLKAQGVPLRTLPPDWVPPAQPESDPDGSDTRPRRDPGKTQGLIQDLDEEAARVESFVTNHLTARLLPSEGVDPRELASRIRETRAGSIVWEAVVFDETGVDVRARVVPSLDQRGFQGILAQVPGVAAADVEGIEPPPAGTPSTSDA